MGHIGTVGTQVRLKPNDGNCGVQYGYCGRLLGWYANTDLPGKRPESQTGRVLHFTFSVSQRCKQRKIQTTRID